MPLPPHLVPLTRYPTKQPILKNLQPKCLTHHERPSFALIKNNKYNYEVHFPVCNVDFLDSTTEILESVNTT